MFIVCTSRRPGGAYDLPLVYFVRVMVAFSSIMVLQKGWFPIDVFFTLSGVSFKLIEVLSSRSISHLLYRFRMIAFHPSTFCRLGLTPRACFFTVTFPFLFWRTGGVLNDSVPVGLLCNHGCDVHPSLMFLWSAVFAIGWLSLRPCGSCGKARRYDQLSTPAAALTIVRHGIKCRRQPRFWGLLYNRLWYLRASYELR